MNIDQIRRIVNTPDMPKNLARAEIIKSLAGDKGAILTVLQMVNARIEADRITSRIIEMYNDARKP